ncbi:CYC2 [Candida oxycetoniae]|uniref:CYC2 n=1 Tax=Candida oxycetoniae TaxID=497107 RepID=A0AAI9SUQ9_9ASCO|nr:CYC2 [Candida oxycetoniae]KAI3403267.2 CYC2 [Candida oxycetoniae]
MLSTRIATATSFQPLSRRGFLQGLLRGQIRLHSQKSQGENPQEEKDSQGLSKKSDADDDNRLSQEFKIKHTTSKSAPAPMENNGIEKLMKKSNKPYIPKLQHQRLSFEYPDLPKEDSDFVNLFNKPKTVSRWTRYIPKILTVIVAAWAAYTVKVWYLDENEEGEDSNELLDVNEFHKFIVTHKEKIDDDHYIIEVTPKYDKWKYSFATNPDKKSFWDGDRIWSVEIKQPDINVVRSYTPLPLYYLKSEYTRSGDKKPLLKVLDPSVDELDRCGTMCFYVKRYKQGEVSRYITDLDVGDEMEIRGPQVEYKFPYHPLKKLHQRPIFKDLASKVEPDNLIEATKKDHNIPDVDNLNFYAAGTGIAPILQVLFSKNPYMGYVNLHYSAQKPGELGILKRFLLFLDKLDRIKIYYHFDTQPTTILNEKDIESPSEPNYYSPKRFEEVTSNMTSEEALKVRLQVMDGKGGENEDNQDNNAKSDKVSKRIRSAEERGVRYETALQQAAVTSKENKKPAALAIVCGPDGFVEYVAGQKDLVNREQGEVRGLLGSKNWNNSNVYKL